MVPHFGGSIFHRLLVTGSEYGVIGPFAIGDILVSLLGTAQIRGDGAVTTLTFGAGLSGSPDESVGNWQSSQALISRSDSRSNGMNVLSFNATTDTVLPLFIPVGVVVSDGSRYVVIEFGLATTAGSGHVFVGAHVQRIIRDVGASAGA